NGYDPEALAYSGAARNALRAELGIAEEDVVVGSLGRYSAAKDQHGFVRAAQAAMLLRPELRFLMVGRGLTHENEALSRQIAATGHPEGFALLGERSDVAGCLSAMDVCCLHSRTEGFPNVLGEAMCVGLPCIATDVGDAARLLGDAGRIVPAGDTTALAQGMAAMAAMDE